MAIALTLPTDHGDNGTWGGVLNTAIGQVNGYDRFARKTADQSVTSNVTVASDSDLAVAVDASGVYVVLWSLVTDGAAAGDIRYSWSGPASATMLWESRGLAAGDTVNVAVASTDVAAIGTAVTHGTIASGTSSRVNGSGLLVVSATAGNLQLQWAQGTSSATATKVKAGSWLWARRVA